MKTNLDQLTSDDAQKNSQISGDDDDDDDESVSVVKEEQHQQHQDDDLDESNSNSNLDDSNEQTTIKVETAEERTKSSEERLPDKDSLKMFVGQIPRDWDEDDCRRLLEPYGEIFAINILKDKNTKQSKGCCFVTYYNRKSALDAQNALHNLKKLPSCRNPIQMKPADNENKNDRKLFVGKLPKFLSEQEVLQAFSPYGQVEECIVLRDNFGQSKGCAFVTFSTRASATAAIRELNQTKNLEGCTTPVVVKFAETSNPGADQRKQQQQLQLLQGNKNGCLLPASSPAIGFLSAYNLGAGGGGAAAANGNPSTAAAAALAAASYFQHHHQGSTSLAHGLDTAAAAAAAATGYNPHHLIKMQSSQLINLNSGGYLTPEVAAAAAYSNLVISNSAAAAAATAATKYPLSQIFNNYTGSPTAIATASPLLANATATTDNGKLAEAIAAAAAAGCTFPSHFLAASTAAANPSAAAYVAALSGYPASAIQAAAAAATKHGSPMATITKQQEGPDGSNLFIYHLPAEYSDIDLIRLFTPFGHVISAKVFIDKNSNLSKCFGFVSYDNPESAQNAIRSMNGFQVMNKRLKVQLKKVREKPY